ncbi:esterase [Skermanella stibiiresistens SB22]|uniref:Esterase n=2 Tax=Skermanella TaxID=204447 RepID=W9GWP9_9PROT|nr:esterase [Skermanella stibiiresistens SB22]
MSENNGHQAAMSSKDGPSNDWLKLPQAERDAAYNNGAAVANSKAHSAERNAASAEFRARRPAKLDLAYGASERLKWDLYPAADPAAPCLAFIHGGYWQMNSREGFACLAEGPLAQGWSVAMPSHTLAPDASLTQIVAEIRAAFDWLAAHGVEHGVAGPIVAAGWSAGGHLTAMVLDHPAVAAGLAISGVYEVGPIRDTYLNEKLALTDAEIETLSPMRLPVVQKPLMVSYGAAELPALVANSEEFHALRAAAGATGALVPITGADHFTVLDELRSPDGILTRRLGELIPTHRP